MAADAFSRFFTFQMNASDIDGYFLIYQNADELAVADQDTDGDQNPQTTNKFMLVKNRSTNCRVLAQTTAIPNSIYSVDKFSILSRRVRQD